MERLARQHPELLINGYEVTAGNDGLTALLVLGGTPSTMLAEQALLLASPVYLLDFDDDAPATTKLSRKGKRVLTTRSDDHPADFLDERGIDVPGFSADPTPVISVSLVEGATPALIRQALPRDAEFTLREHPRGVLIIPGLLGSLAATKLALHAYTIYRSPHDEFFSCVVHSPGQARASYSPTRPDPSARPLENILGETSLEEILRALAIPITLLGLEN